jgi:hypothetical protein
MEKEEFREQWKRASSPTTVNLNNKAFFIVDNFSFFEDKEGRTWVELRLRHYWIGRCYLSDVIEVS